MEPRRGEVRRAREAVPGAPSVSRSVGFLVAVLQFRPHFLSDGFEFLAGFGISLRIQIAAAVELVKDFSRQRIGYTKAPLKRGRA